MARRDYKALLEGLLTKCKGEEALVIFISPSHLSRIPLSFSPRFKSYGRRCSL